jgi:polar amino acid transport system substrate-binding protein
MRLFQRPTTIVAAALAGLLLLAGCGSDDKKDDSSATTAAADSALFSKLPADIQKSKEIKVGSDIEYPPIEFFKEGTQDVQGLDYDLAQAIGQKLGVKMSFINDTDFAGIIGALQSDRFNIIMSAMNDTDERRGQGVDFIDYFTAGSSLLVRKGNPDHINGLDDLCGKTVAIQKGTVQDTDIVTAQEPKCKVAGKDLNVLRFDKDTDALQQVKNGRAVANLEDFPVAAYNAQTSTGGTDFEVAGSQVGDVGHYGIAVPSKNTQLRDAVQAALKGLIDDGNYDKILAKWNLVAGALKTAAINGGS